MKYFGYKIDENLNWKDQTYNIALLYKIRKSVSFNTPKPIYFAIFDSHINYANFVWGQNLNFKLRIITLQKKALRITNN